MTCGAVPLLLVACVALGWLVWKIAGWVEEN